MVEKKQPHCFFITTNAKNLFFNYIFFQGGHQLHQRELEPELQCRLRDVQPGEQDQQGPPGLPPHCLHHPPHGQVSQGLHESKHDGNQKLRVVISGSTECNKKFSANMKIQCYENRHTKTACNNSQWLQRSEST